MDCHISANGLCHCDGVQSGSSLAVRRRCGGRCTSAFRATRSFSAGEMAAVEVEDGRRACAVIRCPLPGCLRLPQRQCGDRMTRVLFTVAMRSCRSSRGFLCRRGDGGGGCCWRCVHRSQITACFSFSRRARRHRAERAPAIADGCGVALLPCGAVGSGLARGAVRVQAVEGGARTAGCQWHFTCCCCCCCACAGRSGGAVRIAAAASATERTAAIWCGW